MTRVSDRPSALFLHSRRLSLLLVPVLVVLSWSAPAQAYTWMIRHGYGGCTTCHADPSGGELLTPYGRAQGDLLLRMRYGADDVSARASETTGSGDSFDSFDSFDADEAGDAEQVKPKAKAKEPEPAGESGPSSTAGFLWGLFETPPWLLLGGSYRHVTLLQDGDVRTFPMQADLYGQLKLGAFRIGGSIGAAKVKPGSPHARAAQVTTAQGDELNLISRTHFIGFDLGERDEWTVRAGRLNLPFGIRIPEHVMWAREATRTDRESDQQHGAALAYSGQSLRGELMAIAGNYQINPDKYRERGYSSYVETSLTQFAAAGVSSMLTFSQADRITLEQEKTTRGAHGVFTRMRLASPLVLLLEADALHMSRRELGYVGFLQLDFEPVQGLHFAGTGEVLDAGYQKAESSVPGIDVPRVAGAGKPRFGGWATLGWFFLPHFELRVDAIARQEAAFALMSQLHVYL